MATISQSWPFWIAGFTFAMPMFAVLRIPHRTFAIRLTFLRRGGPTFRYGVSAALLSVLYCLCAQAPRHAVGYDARAPRCLNMRGVAGRTVASGRGQAWQDGGP